MSRVEYRPHKGLNERTENSHIPLRRREQTMQGFRSAGCLGRTRLSGTRTDLRLKSPLHRSGCFRQTRIHDLWIDMINATEPPAETNGLAALWCATEFLIACFGTVNHATLLRVAASG
jgi:hypothetical protein